MGERERERERESECVSVYDVLHTQCTAPYPFIYDDVGRYGYTCSGDVVILTYAGNLPVYQFTTGGNTYTHTHTHTHTHIYKQTHTPTYTQHTHTHTHTHTLTNKHTHTPPHTHNTHTHTHTLTQQISTPSCSTNQRIKQRQVRGFRWGIVVFAGELWFSLANCGFRWRISVTLFRQRQYHTSPAINTHFTRDYHWQYTALSLVQVDITAGDTQLYHWRRLILSLAKYFYPPAKSIVVTGD